MSNWLQKVRSAPPAEPYQQSAVPSTPISLSRAAAYTRDPNAPDYRYQVNQKLIYERRLPGGSYITAHVQRLQSGYYDSPLIHEDLIDRVRFVAINFVFHPSTSAHRFKQADINIALHHDADGTYQNALDNVQDLARHSVGRGSLSHQHDHATQTAEEQSTALVKTNGFVPKPLVKPTRPKFLRHAPHLLFGSISPETLSWNFNIGGQIGVSQGPANASIKPSGGYKGSYKIYEMTRIQGSIRTLRSWFGRQYDVEDGELVWTMEENTLQKSGLPREFTFVMLLTKGSGPVDTGLGDVILDIDINPKIAGWAGTAASFPGFVTNGPSYRPIHRYPLNLDQDIGQRFEPEEPGKGFNFAKLVCSFDDFVYLPGTVTSTNDSPSAQEPTSMGQQQQSQQGGQQGGQQQLTQPPQQKQLPSSQQTQQPQQGQMRSLDNQHAQGQISMPSMDNGQTLNLRVFLENSRLSPAPQNSSQLNLRIKPPSHPPSQSYATSTDPSRSNRRSITIVSTAPPTRFQSLRDRNAEMTPETSPKPRQVSGMSQTHSLRRSRDYENLSRDYHSSPMEQKRQSTHRDVTSSPLPDQDYEQLDTAVDDEYPDHISTVSRDGLFDRFSQNRPRPMGDPQYQRSNQYTQQHLSSKSHQQQQQQSRDNGGAYGDVPISEVTQNGAPTSDDLQQEAQSRGYEQPDTSQPNYIQSNVPTVAREAVAAYSTNHDGHAPMGEPQYQTQDPHAQQQLVSEADHNEGHSPVVSRVASANPAGLDQPPLLGDPQYKTSDQFTQQHLVAEESHSHDHARHAAGLAEPAEIGRALPMGEPEYESNNLRTQQHLSAQPDEHDDTSRAINDADVMSSEMTAHQARLAHPPLLGDPQYQSNNPYTQQLFSANAPPQHQDGGDHYVTPPQHHSQLNEVEPDEQSSSEPQRSSRPTTEQALDDQVRAHAEFMARELRPETPPQSINRQPAHFRTDSPTDDRRNSQQSATQTSPVEHHATHDIARRPFAHLPGGKPQLSADQQSAHDASGKVFAHITTTDPPTSNSSGLLTPKRQITITHPSNASHLTNFTTPEHQTLANTSADQHHDPTTTQWNDSPPDWLKLSPIKPLTTGGTPGTRTPNSTGASPHLPPITSGSRGGSKPTSAAVSRSSSRSHRRNQSARYEYPDAGVRYDGTDMDEKEKMERGEVLRYGDEGVEEGGLV